MNKKDLINLYAATIASVQELSQEENKKDFYLKKKQIVESAQHLASADKEMLASIVDNDKVLLSAILASELDFESFKNNYFYIENTRVLVDTLNEIAPSVLKDNLLPLSYIKSDIEASIISDNFNLKNVEDYALLEPYLSYNNKLALCKTIKESSYLTTQQKISAITLLDKSYSTNIHLFDLITKEVEKNIPARITSEYMNNIFGDYKGLEDYINVTYGIDYKLSHGLAEFISHTKSDFGSFLSKSLLKTISRFKMYNLLDRESLETLQNLYSMTMPEYKNVCINNQLGEGSISNTFVSLFSSEYATIEHFEGLSRYISTVINQCANTAVGGEENSRYYIICTALECMNILDLLKRPDQDKIIDELCKIKVNNSFFDSLKAYLLLKGNKELHEDNQIMLAQYFLDNHTSKNFELFVVKNGMLPLKPEGSEDVIKYFWTELMQLNYEDGVWLLIRKIAQSIALRDVVRRLDKKEGDSLITMPFLTYMYISQPAFYQNNFLTMVAECVLDLSKKGVIFENPPELFDTNIFFHIANKVVSNYDSWNQSSLEKFTKTMGYLAINTSHVFNDLIFSQPIVFKNKTILSMGDLLLSITGETDKKFKTSAEIMNMGEEKRGIFSFKKPKKDHKNFVKRIYKAEYINNQVVLSFGPSLRQADSIEENKFELLIEKIDRISDCLQVKIDTEKVIKNYINAQIYVRDNKELFNAPQLIEFNRLVEYLMQSADTYCHALEKTRKLQNSTFAFFKTSQTNIDEVKDKLNLELINNYQLLNKELSALMEGVAEMSMKEGVKELKVQGRVMSMGASK